MILNLRGIVQRSLASNAASFGFIILLAGSFVAVNAEAATSYFSLGHGFTGSEKILYDRAIEQHSADLSGRIGKIKSGHEQRVAIGKVVTPLRLELEGSFYKARYQSSVSSFIKGSMQRTSIMGNIYYDFNVSSNYISPFVGAGIGISKVKSVFKIETSTIKQAESKFSFQGIAGLRFNLSPDVAVSIDYRRFATQKLKFQDKQYKVKSINIGIMFKF